MGKLYSVFLLSILFLGAMPIKLFSQDAYFSQFYANPIYLNSALAGAEGSSRLVLMHRQQWNAVNAFNSTFFSFDNPLGKSSGVAVHALKDSQLDGVVNNTSIGTTFSHRIRLNRGAVLGGGIGIAYHQKSFNWNKLLFEDQLRSGSSRIYPSAERIGESKTVMYDVTVGMVYASDRWLAGINISHINQPKERFSPESEARLPRRYTMHLAYAINFTSSAKGVSRITPSLIYENQAQLSYLNVGAYWNNHFLTLGSWYRINQAMVFTAGFSFKQFKIGYSYDYHLNNSGSAFGSTNEFSMSYRFQLKKTNKNYKYAGKCPDVFNGLR